VSDLCSPIYRCFPPLPTVCLFCHGEDASKCPFRQKEDMTIVTERFIRKPLYVDAVQVTEDNFEEIASWCQGEIRNNDGSDDPDSPGGSYIHVRVHNPRSPRQTKGFIGDWLLYTERGYKVYTDKAFHGSFDRLDGVAKDRADQEAKAKLENVRAQVR